MNESKNFRAALLSGGSSEWCDAITPLLLAQTDFLTVVESADELFSIPPASKPEIIFIHQQPGTHGGGAVAEQIREHFAVTPLVLQVDENAETLKTALAVGARAVLEFPFCEESFAAAFNRCCRTAIALRWEELKQQQNRVKSELFMRSPFLQLLVDAVGTVSALNDEAAEIMGIDTDTVPDFSTVCRRFFAPYASTYPLEMETALQRKISWNGILSGRSAGATSRIYRVTCQPFTAGDPASGMLLTLYDITQAEDERSQLRIELQAAHDCLLLAEKTATGTDLQQLCSPEVNTPDKQELFSMHTLLKSVTCPGGDGYSYLKMPDYIPTYFRGDAKRLRYALQAVFSGSALFAKAVPRIALSIKERSPAMMTLQFNISVDSSDSASDSYQNCADYLDSTNGIAHAASGLGLAAILIGQMNGKLFIRTERGCSRTVCCTVPLSPESDESRIMSACVADDVPPTLLPSFKVLVAEDNIMEQTTLKHLLEGIGCQVILVGNGKEAVDEFENGEFDVVLMDILMPVMDGFEATRLIRERERIIGGAVPVMALTSYSLKAIQEKCISVGMNGYLAKPVAKNKLLEALQRLNKSLNSSALPTETELDLIELPVLEPQPVIENLGYDLDVYRELVDMYLNGFADVGNQLAAKLVGDDIMDILECAHGLKGIVTNIGGRRLAEVANRLQDLCSKGMTPDSTLWVPIVTTQTAELKTALANLDWGVLERYVANATVRS